jgi:hypothetical protein
MKKRKIPYLKVTSNMPYDISILMNYQEFNNALFKETITAVSEGVAKNKKRVTLFELHGSGYKIDLEKKSWKSSLLSAMKFFESKEEFEKCAECVNLLKQIENE